MEQKDIDRINELYHKSKSEEGLTSEEKEEQSRLRQAYLAAIRKNMRGTLDNIQIQKEDGTVVDLGKKFGAKASREES